jgi:signal peptidase II
MANQVQYVYLTAGIQKEEKIVLARRARLYDALALLTVIIVVALDQWTKALVVQYLIPPVDGPVVPLIGPYLSLRYIQNRGAAFGMFANNVALTALIGAAICVVAYLYIRMLNTGSLAYKLIFGMIIGGAAGNLLDRAIHGGYVVDFIWFRIPEIGYQFAIFNLADASISVGVFLLVVFLLVGGLQRGEDTHAKDKDEWEKDAMKKAVSPTSQSGSPRSQEQDV